MSESELKMIKEKLINEIRISTNNRKIYSISNNQHMTFIPFHKSVQLYPRISIQENKIFSEISEDDSTIDDKINADDSENYKILIDFNILTKFIDIYKRINEKEYEKIHDEYNQMNDDIKSGKLKEQDLFVAFERDHKIKVNNLSNLVNEKKRIARENNRKNMYALFSKIRPDLAEKYQSSIKLIE